MFEDYKAKKEEVLACCETVEQFVKGLQDYAKSIGLPDPTERSENILSDIRSKVEKVKADRFNIMIAGEAKSGKSTFINAYLGVELLPMDVKQCTSSIVEIKHGDAFSVRATYADGRQKEIKGDEDARAFLRENAALDDKYRDIPVPTINSEILVKSGLRALEKGTPISILKSEVEAMLSAPEVQSANIYNLKPDEYNNKIKAYIWARKNSWMDIVTKIEILFPLGEDFRGIEIIDSPGVCSRGGVAEITSKYIENADAIIFLKPVIGQSLESSQFSQFMENVSVERNKNALFLVLTHIAAKNDADLSRLEKEAKKQFSGKLDKQNILFVDSKAELYSKQFSSIENIEGLQKELRRLTREGTLDPFVLSAYNEISGLFGSGDIADFIRKLQEKSRFGDIYQALEVFGRKAHYLLLVSLLESISRLFARLKTDMDDRIGMYKQKAKDPEELARKIKEIKAELEEIQNKMNRGAEGVVRRFRGEEGSIRRAADEEVKDFLDSVGRIDPDADNAFTELEKLSLVKFDKFKEWQERLPGKIVEAFDRELVKLSDKSPIHYDSIKPDFTDETFQKIMEDTKSQAMVSNPTGGCFKKSHTVSTYVRNRHFTAIKNDILARLEEIKADFVAQLESYADLVRSKYIAELAKNSKAKSEELDAIEAAKTTAEEDRQIIKELSSLTAAIVQAQSAARDIKGGILESVQRNHKAQG